MGTPNFESFNQYDMRTRFVKFLRKVIPKRVKGWMYKLSVSKDVEGSMFFHINNLQRLGYAPSTIIDIGAFRGEWTLNTKAIFPTASIVMIEPQDDKEPILKEIERVHPSITYVKSLVGKEKKEAVTFFEMESGSSIYEEQTTHNRTVKSYPMQTVDSLLIDKALGEECFIKLDVQGAELDVLKGAIHTLKKCSAVLLEASLLNYNQGAPLFADIVAYMKEIGFVVFDICEMRRKQDHTLFQVDLLFLREGSAVIKKVSFNI
jgi:FkbM family methyltransferase